MIRRRPASERGQFDHGWLRTAHTFSFADYHDRAHMGFRSLRVINEDHIQKGAGFGTHPHRDMEILTWILDGALAHKDSMGNGAVIRPGEVQVMSAGTGILHSEHNAGPGDTHLLQIWIMPDQRGVTPRYDQQRVDASAMRDRWCKVAGKQGSGALVWIHQDSAVFAADLATGKTIDHQLGAGRGAWLQIARGRVTCNGTELSAGDGCAIENEPRLTVQAQQDAHLLLFDLA